MKIFVLLALFFCCGCTDSDPPARRSWDGKLNVYGDLKSILHEGKTEGKMRLRDLKSGEGLWGLGVLSGLRGEVTIVGGMRVLAFANDDGTLKNQAGEQIDDEAALLVTAEVENWHREKTGSNIVNSILAGFVEARAVSLGISTDAPIPFVFEGSVQNLEWHVMDGRKLASGPSSHDEHLKAALKFSTSEAKATLVGVWSDRHEGVFTHKDSRVHLHVVFGDGSGSGHVDRVTIVAGAMFRIAK